MTKFKLMLLVFGLILVGCEKESIVDTQSEDLNAVLSTANSNDFSIHPALVFSGRGSATRTNQFNNPVGVECLKLSGYVTMGANGRANYDRVVEVQYVIKDSNFPFQEELLDIESFIVEANKSNSSTRPILRDLAFEVQGELTSSVLSVKRRSNGAVISCNSSTQKTDFVNCFTDPGRQGPGLQGPGPSPDCGSPFCDPNFPFPGS